MSELEKLIEQYEKENPGKNAMFCNAQYYYHRKFVYWLASRPTCGVEQRKFLDEVENGKLQIREEGGIIETKILIEDSCMTQYDFKSDLQKVIKGE
jgi:hypothetical protein